MSVNAACVNVGLKLENKRCYFAMYCTCKKERLTNLLNSFEEKEIITQGTSSDVYVVNENLMTISNAGFRSIS